MPSPYRSWLLACSLIALCPSGAVAADIVSGSAFGERFPGDESAYGGTLSFQHSADSGGMLFSLSDTKFPIGSLSVVDVDGYRHEWEHVFVSVGASLGDSVAEAHSSTLYKARLNLDYQVSTDWTLRAGDQFIDLDTIHGQLMNAGAVYRVTPTWSVNVAGGYGLSGTLGDRYGQLAFDWFGPWHAFGGIILGQTGYDPGTLRQTSSISRLLQLYVDASIPVARGNLTVGIDTLNLEGASRQTIRVGFAAPVKL